MEISSNIHFASRTHLWIVVYISQRGNLIFLQDLPRSKIQASQIAQDYKNKKYDSDKTIEYPGFKVCKDIYPSR